jgi:hypothetical protein
VADSRPPNEIPEAAYLGYNIASLAAAMAQVTHIATKYQQSLLRVTGTPSGSVVGRRLVGGSMIKC